MLSANIPKIFLYHRFSAQGTDISHRVSADVFRWQLKKITKHYQVFSFGDCLNYYHQYGYLPKRCAVITVDDGYQDFYQYAYPELKRLHLPATFFVTVNFVDRKIWLWPDRLDYALKETIKKDLVVQFDGNQRVFPLKTKLDTFATWKALSDYCIAAPDQEKIEVINSVEANLEVELPAMPPEDYAAVTWDELREMAINSIEIGSHTMNHPILSRISHDQLQHEIAESRTILEQKLKSPVRTFCYPNGHPGDINDHIIDVVRKDYIGAPYWFDLTFWQSFKVPRMGLSNDRDDFCAKMSGFEYLGIKMRKVFGGTSF